MNLPGLVQFRLCKIDNQEMLQRVAEGLERMYTDGKVPSRNVPARPDSDFDLLVGELIVRFQELENDLSQIKEVHGWK